jgi:hypothetical protein
LLCVIQGTDGLADKQFSGLPLYVFRAVIPLDKLEEEPFVVEEIPGEALYKRAKGILLL